MLKTSFYFVIVFLLLSSAGFAQKKKYSHADSLKGSITKEREWWDVTYYDLSVRFNLTDSSISGSNRIQFVTVKESKVMQIDLMQPLKIDSAIYNHNVCKMRRDGNAYFIQIPSTDAAGVGNELLVYFHGKPVVAKLAPWDGGVVWSKDKNGNPWVSIACQGMAAQAWFPNKDHMYDEVNGCSMSITAPSSLVTVGNGHLKGVKKNGDNTSTYTWEVKNPINNYCIIPYIGNYSNFHDTITGEGGLLNLDFWVLSENVSKAKIQFQQVKPMLHCFEYWFGKYPFYEDGYKLVEAPFLGMEHQSAIAYGNDYVDGYKGRDLSLSGWGLKWDFIIIHESGHEWFGNSISAKDVADNWIHESFTAYAENLYTEYLYGKKAGAEYVIGTRKSITNDKPIISDYNVNAGGSIDLYYKGANMLHTMRQLVNNDSLWRAMLRGLNSTFYHQTVSTADIEYYMGKFLKMDLSRVFEQYLRTVKVPELEYKLTNKQLSYRWNNVVEGFNMPVGIEVANSSQILKPSEHWQKMNYPDTVLVLDPDFYVNLKRQR